jgi:hypothetical protein
MFCNYLVFKCKWMDRKNKSRIVVAVFPELTQTVAMCMYIAADCCSQRHSACYVQLHNTTHLLYKYYKNCTDCN